MKSEYLGSTGEQAYTILSCAPVDGRVGGVVDFPNACVSIAVPTEIFDFDIRPNAHGPEPYAKEYGADLAACT